MTQEYVYEKDGRRRKAVWVVCEFCGKHFLVQERFAKNDKRGHYCSKDCVSNDKKKRIVVVCHVCGKETERTPSRLKKSKHGLFFCSRKCKEFAQSAKGDCKEIQPGHYGTGRTYSRKKALSHFPNVCNRCGYDKVPGVLMVHHIDRNGENNELDNLEVLCPTCHFEEHFIHRDGMFYRLGK